MQGQELTAKSIEYSRTIVPSSMRSPYWKYFGFPSDNANNILTKQKIICTLCNAAIAYNKNTSNLRTHILARHCELLHELQQQQQHNGVGGNTAPITRKRLHSDTSSLTLPSNDAKAETINNDSYIETDYKRHTSLIVEERDDLVELVEGGSSTDATVVINTADTLDYGDYTTSLEPSTADCEDEELDQQQYQKLPVEVNVGAAGSYSLSSIESDSSCHKVANSIDDELTSLIVDMLIKDVLPLTILDGAGIIGLFSRMGNVDKSAVERKLNSFYVSMLQCITEHLEQYSQKNRYSLSVEFSKNVDNFSVICVYVNYYSAEQNDLLSILLQNIVSSSVDEEINDFQRIFKNFNMSNCAAAILNESNMYAELFFQTHEIPVIPCMEAILRRCLRLFFDLPTVNDEFTRILKVTENAIKADSTLIITLPEVYPQCPWSKLNLLQFIHENLSFNSVDDAAEILKETRDLIEYVTPLKFTLDTIAEEPLTLCSLMRPLTVKLLEEHFDVDFLGLNHHLIEFNGQLHEELTSSILKNKFLNEATFLDARFRSDFLDSNQVKDIKDAICVRFKPILQLSSATLGIGVKQIKVEYDTSQKSKSNNSNIGNQRKSSLKSFFKVNTEPCQKRATTQKFNIDYEISKYNCEPPLDLEQCPITWWNENSYNYKQLKQIADYYINVPCCINRMFRIGIHERNELQNKRLMLRNQYAQQIWYLHYNEKFYDKIRQT